MIRLLDTLKTVTLALLAVGLTAFTPAHAKQRPAFMDEYSIGWSPYSYPWEASVNELDKIIDEGYTCIHLTVAPLQTGPDQYTSIATVDQAVAKCVQAGRKIMITMNPRWPASMGIGDTFNDGLFYEHDSYADGYSYSLIDIFDSTMVDQYVDYCRGIIQRYQGATVSGSGQALLAFVFTWGYQAETGFYTGDFNASSSYAGSLSAGYSPKALTAFNQWRTQKGLATLSELPQPSDPQTVDFARFMRFRQEYIANNFHDVVATRLRAYTSLPIGTFTYLDSSPDNYARNWSWADACDFGRTAGIAHSFHDGAALVDSGQGWEGCYQHGGTWDYTGAAMRRDQFSNIAYGNHAHGMFVRVYDTDPTWETGIYSNISNFLTNPAYPSQFEACRPQVALYVPTWVCGLLPYRSASQPFLPSSSYTHGLAEFSGLVESFGLTCDHISDAQLLDPEALAQYKLVIVPASSQLQSALFNDEWNALSAQTNVYLAGASRPTRDTLRSRLEAAGLRPALDYAGDELIAGARANFLWNWDNEPHTVNVNNKLLSLNFTDNTYTDTFAGTTLSSVWSAQQDAKNFSLVSESATIPSGDGKVLALQGSNILWLSGTENWDDVSVSCWIKPPTGSTATLAQGVIACAADDDPLSDTSSPFLAATYLYDGGPKLRLWGRVFGATGNFPGTTLATVDAPTPDGEYHKLTLRVSRTAGDALTTLLWDGTTMAQFSENSWWSQRAPRGRAGLFSYFNESTVQTRFDQFEAAWHNAPDPSDQTTQMVLAPHEKVVLHPPRVTFIQSASDATAVIVAAAGSPLYLRVNNGLYNTRSVQTDWLEAALCPAGAADQVQAEMSSPTNINMSVGDDQPLAQSFVPLQASLKRLALRGGKIDGYTGPLTLKLGTALGQSNVATLTVPNASLANYATATNGTWTMIDTDWTLTPGTVYFLQIETSGATTTGARFVWCWDTAASYPQGQAYQNGVAQAVDFCFATFSHASCAMVTLHETAVNSSDFRATQATSVSASSSTILPVTEGLTLHLYDPQWFYTPLTLAAPDPQTGITLSHFTCY